MYKYIFIGKLEPANLIKDVNMSSTISLNQPDTKIKGDLKIKYTNTQIEILYLSKVNHSLPQSANLETLKNYIQESVELLINIYGYVNSLYLDVYILSVKCEELGIEYTFGIKGEFNITKSKEESQEEHKKLFNVFHNVNNFPIKEVFSDFKKSIKYPAMTGQFCFRAIEIIRTHYYEDLSNNNEKKRRKDGWTSLRKDLGYSKKDFDLIIKYGEPNRHGIYPAITYEKRQQIMNFTRNLIDTFIENKVTS